MKSSYIVCATLGALAFAGAAAASTLPATAAVTSTGKLSFNATDGFTFDGKLTAEYRQPPLGPRPYTFNTNLSFDALIITPVITLTTSEIVIREKSCNPFFCIPAQTIPAGSISISPRIPVTSVGTVYDLSFTSPDLAAEDVLAFDYGTPLLGAPLTFGEVVQDQFETGDTTVSVVGGFGPFNGIFGYSGVLQPDGQTILADYSLNVTGPGFLAGFEDFALGIVNDNTDQFTGLAFDLFLDSKPCDAFRGLPGVCDGILAGLNLDQNAFGITVDSLGTVIADYTLAQSITPVPLPVGLPLLLAGLGSLAFMRKRKAKTA